MKILGSGYYIPKREVTSEEVDIIADLEKGTTFKKTGIKKRYYADYNNTETSSYMAKFASEKAIKNSGIKKEEIDLIIGANASREILLPCSASLVQKKLGLENNKTASFDVDSTCISFLSALDVADSFLKTKKYKNILIVSSEIASIGIDYNKIESGGLFGDGAAAFIVTMDENSLKSKFQTFPEGVHYTEIRGGGTRYLVRDFNEGNKEDYLFQMEGRKSFKLIKQKIREFYDEFIEENGIDISKIDRIVLHQASVSGLKLIGKYLEFESDKMINIVADYGNMIAASIPFSFAHAIENGTIKRGDKLLMLGTSAGMTIGMTALEY